VFEEDFYIPGAKTAGENAALWHTCAIVIVGAWGMGGASPWTLGLLMAAGFLSPIMVVLHQSRGDFRRRGEFARYIGYLLLLVPLFGIYGWASTVPLFTEIEAYGEKLLALETPPDSVPVAAAPKAYVWSLLVQVAFFLSALNVRFLVGERWVLRRILLILAFNAVGLSLLGFLQRLIGFKEFLGLLDLPRTDFFATFIHPSHWSGFAFLWLVAMMALVSFYKTRRSWKFFSKSPGLYCLAGAIALMGSIIVAGQALYIAVAGLFMGVSLLVIGGSSILRSRGKWQAFVPSVLVLAFALGLLGYAAKTASQAYVQAMTPTAGMAELLQYEPVDSLRDLEARPVVYADTYALFQDRPWFGWGQDAFPVIYPLFRDPALPQRGLAHPGSDVLVGLMEGGLVYFILWGLVVIIFTMGAIFRGGFIGVSGSLFYGLLLVLPLAVLDFPFANPAFVLSFWILLGIAVRWAQIKPANPNQQELNIPV